MKDLTDKLAKFGALSRSEQMTVLVAAAWLPLFWIGLRSLGLYRFQAWLQRTRSRGSGNLTLGEVAALGNLVNIAGRHAPCPVTCLSRSSLLVWLLQRRGVAAKLRIGVRFTQGNLDAHAWVEYAGIPVNDRPDIGQQFAPFSDTPPLESFPTS